MRNITFTTDFGTEDGNVGVMKGIVWGICPEAKIIDISHQIAPQNIRQAAFVLARQVFYFPANTVHIVVVDPGVGTSRRPLAAQIGSQFFVGPDNGVFTPLYQRAEQKGWPLEIIHTSRPQFWRDEISHIFHGRDIFSPVGAHLACGVPLEALGERIDDPVTIPWTEPQWQGDRLVGEIRYIDHFGNLFTNITRQHLMGKTVQELTMGEYRFPEMVQTFGERPSGSLIVLYSSTDEVLIARVNGSAAEQTGAQPGNEIQIKLTS